MKIRVTVSLFIALILALEVCLSGCDFLKSIVAENSAAENDTAPRAVFAVTDPVPLKNFLGGNITLELLEGDRFDLKNKVEYPKESGFDEIELKAGWCAISTNSGTYVYSGDDTIILTLTSINEKYVFENEEDRLAVKNKYDQTEGDYYDVIKARLSETGYAVSGEGIADLSRTQYELKLVKSAGKAYITQIMQGDKSEKYYYNGDYALIKTESDSRTVEYSYDADGEPAGKTVIYEYEDEGKSYVSVTEYKVVKNSFRASRYTLTEDGVVKIDDYYDDDIIYD